MKKNFMKYPALVLIIFISLVSEGCLFVYINQPSSAETGEVIDIQIAINSNDVPEPNAHKGILGILAPEDWNFISADYTSSIGNGSLTISEEWQDSVEKYYPAANYDIGMKWFVLLSDTGYAFNDPVIFTVNLKMQTGEKEGCYNIGYLTTKATSGMLNNSSWSPMSFPHPIGIPDSNLCKSKFEVRTAPEWDNILDRSSGWTGSDGIYSIPINGSEQPENNSKHLLVFSDTFIGEVDSNGRRISAKMVNNTLALLSDIDPAKNEIEFFWRTDGSNNPQTVFVPETPGAKSGDWYWLMDGISIDSIIYVYALRLHSAGSGAFGFEVNGVVLLKFMLDEESFIKNVEQSDTPLFYKNANEKWDIVMGQAVMPMNQASGYSFADGYIYVYGPRSHSQGKDLIASRVLPENIEDFDEYNFWNGSDWNGSIETAASITSGISQEFSVTPISENEFLLTYQTGNNVAVKVGQSPAGQFGIMHTIYNCPEVQLDPDIFIYNAKAHPSLSLKNELLISYNVNSTEFADHFSNADIYRPRFIYLKLNDTTATGIDEVESVPTGYLLNQNYPNPFNPTTIITFSIAKNSYVQLSIFDILGNKIADLIKDELTAGAHSYELNINNLNQRKLSSGIYFYQLKADNFNQTKKMIYLK